MMQTQEPTAKGMVKIAMEALDQVNPGWEVMIDLDTLNMGSIFQCVLGQVYGTYLKGLTALEGVKCGPGFVFAGLEDEWKEAIRTRQIQAAIQKAMVALDQVKPGWESLVDLDKLSMISLSHCVLGQVFKEEAAASERIWGFGYGNDALKGIYNDRIGVFANYKNEWKAAITARRAVA